MNDTIISAWEATELISVEDPFLRDDIESLRDLQEVCILFTVTIYAYIVQFLSFPFISSISYLSSIQSLSFM